jgi:hypothetical protein
MSAFGYSPGYNTGYKHVQSVLSTAWVVNHKLNRVASITTYRSDGLKVEGTVVSISPNVSTVTFAFAAIGIAYCI